MPQQTYAGFTPDPKPDYSGFTPDPPQAAAKPEASWWDTAASYVPQPVKDLGNWATTAPEWITKPINKAAMAGSEYINPNREADYGLKSVASAYLESLGDVTGQMATPLNVATAGAFGASGTAAKYGAPTLAKGMNTVGKALSGSMVPQGMYHASQAETIPEAIMAAVEAVGGYLGTRTKVPAARPKAAPIDIPPIGAAPNAMADLPLRQQAAPIEARIGAPEQQVRMPPGFQPDMPVTYDQVHGGTSPRYDTSNAPVAPAPEVVTPQMREGLLQRGFRDPEINRMPIEEALTNLEQPAPPPIERFPKRIPEGTEHFDPTTLQGLEPAPVQEIQFVDPTTGEIKPASQAKPGDVPITEQLAKKRAAETAEPQFADIQKRMYELIDKEQAGTLTSAELTEAQALNKIYRNHPEFGADVPQVQTKRASKQTPKLTMDPISDRIPDGTDLAVKPKQAPPTFAGWLEDLAKGEGGEADIDFMRNRRQSAESQAAEAPAERPITDPNTVPLEYRQNFANYTDERLQEFIARHENGAGYQTENGQRILNHARDVLDERTARMSGQTGMYDPDTGPISNTEQSLYDQVRARNPPLSSREAHGRYPEATRSNYEDPYSQSTINENYAARKGKSLDEVEAAKSKPALERLGKLVGEDRAAKLASGETKINFDEAPSRGKAKRLLKGNEKSWNSWGDSLIKDAQPNPSKPGISVEPHGISNLFPNSFEVTYRDAKGNPLGILKTDLQGKGIGELAVHTGAGIGRGKIAFKMLKEAMDRGVTEPSGATSDFTKNLIDRVKRLAKNDKGEIDFDKVYEELNQIMTKFGNSKVGGAINRFLKDETGEGNIGTDPQARLRELFDKKQAGGALTAEELAEAQSLASKNKLTPKEYVNGKTQVDTGELNPANTSVGKAPLNPPPDAQVVQSLQQRLQKAVADAGKPNPQAADEITSLVKEAEEVLNQMPDGPNKQGAIRKVLGANRALLTSWDLSAPGRQGKALMLTKAWWTSLDDMVKAWTSEGAAKQINQSILDHPSGYFDRPVSNTGKVGKSYAEKAGLDLVSTEEMFKTTLGTAFEKYSGIGKAGRAHTAFLNKLRSDHFINMLEGAKKAGMPITDDLAKKYATFINNSTGRGSVNIGDWQLERNINALNDVFFAPKNLAGQIRTWKHVLDLRNYSGADPVMRQQSIKQLLAVAGTGLGVSGLAKMAGAKVSYDPVSSDFAKIRIGDTRIDLFGGYQQLPVAAMKFLSGQSTITAGKNAGKTQDLDAGKFGQQTRGSVAERFFTNRLSPVASFVWAWSFNREFDGKPFEYKRALFERTFPIAAKDIFDLAQEDPFIAAMLTPTTLMGLTGTQHYSGKY